MDLLAFFRTAEAEPYFHGTRHTLTPGQVLEGGSVRSNQGYGTPGEHVYFSKDRGIAHEFAEAGYGPDGDVDAKPKVYHVEPLDHVEDDPDEEPEAKSYRSKRVRVVKQATQPPSVQDLMDMLGTDEWHRAMTHADSSGESMHLPTPSVNNKPRKGYFPGEDLAGIDKGPKVGWVKTDALIKHREYDRADPSQAYHESRANIDKIKSEMTEHGMREPVIMAHDAHSDRALLVEGNHRLAAAHELGWPAVPVHVVRGFRHEFETEGDHKHLYLGSHKVVPDKFGYTPGTMHPNEALPDEYLHTGDAGLRPKTAMGAAGPDYDNLSFTHVPESPRANNYTWTIYAHHPEHGEVGQMEYDKMTWPEGKYRRSIKVNYLNVDRKHQRRGVTSQLMSELERKHPGLPIDHGERTMQGGDWAANRWGNPGHPIDHGYAGGFTLNGQPFDPKTGALYDEHVPEYQPAPEGASDDEIAENSGRNRARKQDWTREMRKAMSRGDVHPDDAVSRGYHPTGWDTGPDNVFGPKKTGWKPLPSHLYHATTDLAGVLGHGLKSRDDLGQDRGRGLGGGESDTVSFTDDPHLAHSIVHSMHEMHDVANLKKTPAHLWDEAQQGTGASRPFHEEFASAMKGSGGPRYLDAVLHGRTLHQGLHTQDEMDARGDGKWEPHPETDSFKTKSGDMHNVWHRDSTPEEKRSHAVDMYRSFARFREAAGGRPDPVFFTHDSEGFAKMDPSNFGVVHAKPKAGTVPHGYQMGGMGEWRTTDASNIDLVHHDRRTAVKGDGLPPEPGTSPIPEGHLRLWHYTGAPAQKIHDEGVLESHARGDGGRGAGNEPSAGVWASTRGPSRDDLQRANYVEFHAHPSEISGRAESPWNVKEGDHEAMQEWGKGNHHVIMNGDVKPHQIAAIHEPWHAHVRYMNEPGNEGVKSDALNGGFDNLLDDLSYGPAIRHIKAQGSAKIASWDEEDQDPDEDTETDWKSVLPDIKAMHRGQRVEMPEGGVDREPHQVAHDLIQSAMNRNRNRDGLGYHWSDQEHEARRWSAMSDGEHRNAPEIQTVLHARPPKEEHIQTSHDWMMEHGSRSFHSGEGEIPMRGGTDVNVTGVSWKHPETGQWIRHDFDKPVQKWARWLPHDRIFGPGHHGLDPRLFDPATKKMRPEVSGAILGTLDTFWRDTYPEWRSWAHVYLAGSEASEWYGNNDFDTLIGVDHKKLRKTNPEFADMLDDDIDVYLTTGLRTGLTARTGEGVWFVVPSGTWLRDPNLNPELWQNSSDATSPKESLRQPSQASTASTSPRYADTSGRLESAETSSDAVGIPRLDRLASVRSAALEDGSVKASATHASSGTTGPTISAVATGSPSRSTSGSALNRGASAGSVGSTPDGSLSITTTPVARGNRPAASASEGFSASAATTPSATSASSTSTPLSLMWLAEPRGLPSGVTAIGPFETTWYVNPNSWDIRDIKPYAAYDITRSRWIVEPVHPADDWGPEKLPSAFWDEAEAIVKQVHAIEAMPEPMRTGRGAALLEYLHSDRKRAFGPMGTGVYDPGNSTWKYLDMHPDRPLAALIDLKRRYTNKLAAKATA